MSEFFDNYLNIKKILESKKEYRQQMERVKALPEEYQYVFRKIQEQMWRFASGAGYDMMALHQDLLELFEAGAADGKPVLEITGEDVAAFCDELLRSVRTSEADWRASFNRKIRETVEKKSGGREN